MATYPITHINSEMRGAPIIAGNARGNLIAAIDAWCTGFGLVTAIKVTVAAGVATAELQPGQGFDLHTVIEVAGATPAALNGKSRVIEVVGGKDIKFPTMAPDGIATGTITIKVAGSGWTKAFTAANKAVYRSPDVLGSRHFYRIDESGGVTNMARVRGFENMTTVDAGTGLYPTNTQINGGGYWVKSYQADAAPVRYDIFGDSRFVMIAIASAFSLGPDYKGSVVRGFGDPIALNPAGDAYSACISCSTYTSSSDPQYGGFNGPVSLGAGAIYAARSRAATGTSRDLGVKAFIGTVSGYSGEDGFLGALSDQPDGAMKFSQAFLFDDSSQASYTTPRAVVPGLLYVPHSGVVAAVQARDYLMGTEALDGRILMALPVSISPGSYSGVHFVDLTGPWRPL